jgi:zeaxanthin glucosyltransferase
MKIGFISFAVPGHFNPMSALARQLQSRNHDVVMSSLPVVEPLARAANLPFIPFGENEFPNDKAGEILGTLSRLKGEEGLQFTVDAIAQTTKLKWRTFPKLLSANGIDALVLDDCDFYSEVVPMSLGMPYAILSSALHCCSTTTSFHFVPTLERTTREMALLTGKSSPFVRQRGILCG